jgi:hypothetical protein
MEWIQNWIMLHAPVQSETLNRRCWIFGSLIEMYGQYCQDAEKNHFQSVVEL